MLEVHRVDLEDATTVCRRGVPSVPPVGALLVPPPLLPQARWPEGVMLPDGGLVMKDHEMDLHVPRHHQQQGVAESLLGFTSNSGQEPSCPFQLMLTPFQNHFLHSLSISHTNIQECR